MKILMTFLQNYTKCYHESVEQACNEPNDINAARVCVIRT